MDHALYDEFAEVGDDHWWFRGRRHIVGSVLAAELGEPSASLRVFEVGCGTGAMLDILAPHGAVGAIDMSPEAVAYCHERHPGLADVRVGQIPDDLPAPESVDVIAAFDVMEHLDDDVEALARIRQALRPGGRFVCTVPAFQFLWSAHDEINHHKRRYRARMLRARLVEAGFIVDRLTYFNSWLFPVAVAVRLASRIRGGPARSDLAMPPAWLNELLTRLFSSEARVLRKRSLPVGVSLLAVGRRP